MYRKRFKSYGTYQFSKSPTIIPKERKIHSLSEAYSMLSEEKKKKSQTIDSIFEINEESFESVLSSISEPRINQKIIDSFKKEYESLFNKYKILFSSETVENESTKLNVCNMMFFNAIKYGATIRPKKFMMFKRLYDALATQRDIKAKFIQPKQLSPEEEIISNDDVKSFIKLSGEPQFNPQTKINNLTYMQIMTKYGSVKIFKYALLDGSFSIENVAKYAVQGGSNEIIALLKNANVSFDNCFTVALKYHRLDIADHLLENYECEFMEDDTKNKEFIAFDDRIAYFLVENKIETEKNIFDSSIKVDNINLYNDFKEHYTAGHIMTEACYSFSNDIILEKLSHNFNDLTGFFNSLLINNNVEMALYIAKHFNVNIENVDKETIGQSNNIELIKYFSNLNKNIIMYLNKDIVSELIKDGTFTKEYLSKLIFTDNNSSLDSRNEEEALISKRKKETLLNRAVCNNDFEMVKYLVEKIGVNINETESLYYYNRHRKVPDYLLENQYSKTPLCNAIENVDLEMAKYLVEHGANLERVSSQFYSRSYCDKEPKLDTSAFQVAHENGFHELFDYLKNLHKKKPIEIRSIPTYVKPF